MIKGADAASAQSAIVKRIPRPISHPTRCRDDGIARQASPPMRYETAAEFREVRSPGKDDDRTAEDDDHGDRTGETVVKPAQQQVDGDECDERQHVAKHHESRDRAEQEVRDPRRHEESDARTFAETVRRTRAAAAKRTKMSCGSMMNAVCMAGSFESGGAISVRRRPKKAATGDSTNASPSEPVRSQCRGWSVDSAAAAAVTVDGVSDLAPFTWSRGIDGQSPPPGVRAWLRIVISTRCLCR